MPHKMMSMLRAQTQNGNHVRPIMLAIAGDSAAGKTTITKGLTQALGPDRVTAVCVDDYHRFDRIERKSKPFTPLHPDCNYVDIMEQHLQLLATGQPILKPVYDHATGMLTRPEYIEPRDYIIIEGLLPLHSKLSRACFDVTVYLDPPEDVRGRWKVQRDTQKRGYTEEEVLADLRRREPESAAFIRPQRSYADIVVQFARVEGIDPSSQLSATVLLRPTIAHPDISSVLTDENRAAMHLKLVRDADGKPVDALHIHGHAPRGLITSVENLICSSLDVEKGAVERLGYINESTRSDSLAVTQLILLYHMLFLSTKGPDAEKATAPIATATATGTAAASDAAAARPAPA